ncbi:MAG: SPASM domain-containing protein [Candidatus Omnitrophota bacterium]
MTGVWLSKMESVQLASGVRLRPEYFGGLVYDTRNGNIVEVNKGAFQFLNLIKDTPQKISNVINCLVKIGLIKQDSNSTKDTLHKLFDLKIIEMIDGTPSSSIAVPQQSNDVEHRSWLCAPETVHWAVTYRCDKNCPDCYVARFSFLKNELNTCEALKLIDKIANWNVFQLAIGGGEPFAREDLLQLLQYAAQRGLSVHVTTGKLDVASKILKSVSPFIRSLQIGVRNDFLLGAKSKKYTRQLHNFLINARKRHIKPGINLILTKSAIERLECLITILINIGFNHIVLLRYKPPQSIERWKTEHPEPCQMKGLHNVINKIIRKYPQLNLRVDCALSFVQRYLSKETATQYGIKGCVAAGRILALAPDGSIYPCSQLVHPKCYAGNLLESEPQTLWDKSEALRRYRFFHTKKTFCHSWCGVCLAKASCGGCRIFAMDGVGGDSGCPEPLLPSLRQIGKVGRRLDLSEYLKKHHIISVGEYMKRYGVEQKTAIKELKVSPQTTSTTARPMRKKTDAYEYVEDDIIKDIQDSIGYTSGGIPFASHEEIAQAIEDSAYSRNYPQWIKL